MVRNGHVWIDLLQKKVANDGNQLQLRIQKNPSILDETIDSCEMHPNPTQFR